MLRSLVAVTAIVLAAVLGSPCLALQVTISSPASAFVQGEPIYVWIDYYNETGDDVAVSSRYLIGSDVLTIRARNGEVLNYAFEAEHRGPRGRNQVRRIGAKEHLVFLTNLLDMFNLKDPGTFSVQLSTANYKPELDLDKTHPLLPASMLVRGKIESNRWEFTIAPGSGEAFELAAKDENWGLFGLHRHAEQIAREYPDSPYAPYAMMDGVEQLLYAEGSGPEPLKDRLVSARARMSAFREEYSTWRCFNIALIRYAEGLRRVGENGAALIVLREVQQNERSDVARLYANQLLSQASATK